MDELIQLAKTLASAPQQAITPISNRIAYVVSHGQSYASNGYAIRTQGIAKALNQKGFETLCFVRPGRPWDLDISKGKVNAEMLIEGVRYIHSPWPLFLKPDTSIKRFTHTVQRFIELFRVYRPQVVLAASNHEVALPALVAARQLGLPFQYEVRGFWEVSRASREPGWEKTPQYQEHLERESWVINMADKLYTLNTQMKQELVNRGASENCIQIVPNSVSVLPEQQSASTVRADFGIPEGAYVLGYVGAITEYEGLEQLVEAVSKLRNDNVYALLVGGYSPVNHTKSDSIDPVIEELYREIKRLKVEDRVIFAGRVEFEKLPNYFAAIDTTVIPRKPLPVCELVSAIKPLEYLSYGKPVIASNVAPQAEVLEQGKLGWLFEKGNVDELVKTILEVKNADQALLKEKSDLGKVAVETRYLWKNSVTPIVEGISNNAKFIIIDRPKIACIMDDFTYQSYSPEASFYQLTPNNWLAELEASQPDMLFIESAWRGKGELWGSKVGHKGQEVQGIVKWCNENGVPTIFWNKEDPVHFETFLNTAKLFDHVFTTDLDCIYRYKGALGHNRVYFLPFACQPRITNPIETYERKSAFCFAGAYYVRYPDRTKDLEAFTEEFPKFRPLEIYDRNYGKDDPNYQFPCNYQPYIVGTLPFSEIDKAYKGYRYAINLNSIKQSQTMFARRVYELLGSNTITVSNFSRGIRLMFGDLVLTSDSGAEIVNRLESLESNGLDADKFRMAGLRKVLTEHTYQARLDYILTKVSGKSHRHSLPGYTVISKVVNDWDVEITLENFCRQNHEDKHLVLITDEGYSMEQVRLTASNCGAPVDTEFYSLPNLGNGPIGGIAKPGTWIAAFCTKDYYGPNYLLDFSLATRFSDAPVIGKAAYYEANLRGVQIKNADYAYKLGATIPMRSGVIAPREQTVGLRDWVESMETTMLTGESTQSIDAFNYAKGLFFDNKIATQYSAVRSVVDDAKFDEGIPLDELTRLAENTPPKERAEEQSPSYTPHQLNNVFSNSGSKSTQIRLTDDGLLVTSSLADGKHEYIYLKAGNEVPVDELLQGVEDKTKLPLHLEMTPGLNLSLVTIFFDSDGNRLNHNIVPANKNSETEVKPGATKVRFGYRVYQGGHGTIKKLIVGKKDLSPPVVLGRSDVLVLTNNYPSYTDLYRNGFVHSRVKGYRKYGQEVDVFRFKKDQPVSWHEFQGVDVITGSQVALDSMLASGRYRHVLVHFLDLDMWNVLSQYIERVKVTVWLHGAEIHPWYRRKFNIYNEQQEEIAISASDKRMEFWKSVLDPMHPNLKLIFVSNYFASEVMEDLGFQLPKGQYEIIHNPINTELFNYIEKPAKQRYKLLSIRPFASRQYANDITVAAILELSKMPFFKDLEIRIIGDGPLFEETVQPIGHFENVILEKRFVAQPDIARLHKEYGLFLCPTRWDSQGVSRDEAMSSGLVVCTTNTAAVSEFVDEKSAVVVPDEHYKELALSIYSLVNNEALFLKMSKEAHIRIRKTLAFDLIIPKEIKQFSKVD